MNNFLIYLIISVLVSFGASVALVKKGRDFPIKRFRILLQNQLHEVYWKAAWLLYCTTCTSFWMAAVVDLSLFFWSGGGYFFWPWSGFITLGLTYVVMTILAREPVTIKIEGESK
jgi:hypothetical protein